MALHQETEVQAVPEAIKAGMRLAHPPPGDEVVISGVAGYFPDSKDVYHFRDNLMNKVDMVSDDNRRWELDHPDIPQRTGKLLDIKKFDASFFGVLSRQASAMDPMCRMTLEKTYEAIVDAGINPYSLKGQRIGVFFGILFSESERTWLYEKLDTKGLGLTGCNRANIASRISYWLGVNGPCYVLDSACSSSLYALEYAYRSIRNGHCNAAVVGGANLCLHPYVSLQYSRLGVLSPQGMSKSFDRDANGYARSEAVCAIYLQKAQDAKRVYATVIHAKTNCDGYKEQGLTYPSGKAQELLLEEFYQECGISPTELDYIEAHGTGTKVGDPEELNALDRVICKRRKTPLPIGSVKSNIGHSEPASGLCAISKVLIAMETGIVPPNLHYYNPREGVEALVTGRLKVITEKCPMNVSLVGVNSFGFGGANAHILLQWNKKNKINGGTPTDKIPRLVVASGRTEEAVDAILKDFESRPVDEEYVYLMHDLQSTHIPGHFYRGYTLLSQDGKKLRSIQYYSGRRRPVWFVFPGLGSQRPGTGKALLSIPIFAAAIEKCQRALKSHGVDLFDIITSENPSVYDNILNCFVGTAACQVGLVDILKAVGIEADGIVGHSVGELGCSYMDGSFTAEQTILAAYYCGRATIETKLIQGLMAEIRMGAKEAKQLCPTDTEVACHNGPDFCTVSGPAQSVKKLVKTLQQQGVVAKDVNYANTALHSKYMAPTSQVLLKYLREVIPRPKPRSAYWVSSSVPQSAWNTPLATHSSAEYHTNNLLSTVLFEEALHHIPANAIRVEIGPHGLLQAIQHSSLRKTTTNIALMERGHSDCTEVLLAALGRLYELGLQPQLAHLYPPVEYPVCRGTPMISPLVRWEHSEDWYVTSYKMQEKMESGERFVMVSLENEGMNYLSGHVVDGRNLFPAMGYIALVWESVGLMIGRLHTQVSVVFRNVQFNRATNIPKEGSIEFVVMVQKGSGKFEVAEGSTAVVTGSVQVVENISSALVPLNPPEPFHGDDLLELTSQDIYKELRLRGYNYCGLFRSLVSTDNLGRTGKIRWCKNWVAFMDNMLQINILSEDTRGLFVPTSLQKLSIDTEQHAAILQSLATEKDEVVIPVYNFKEAGIIRSGGIEVQGLKATAVARRKPLGVPVLEKYVFIPNLEPESLDCHTALRACVHCVLENQLGNQVKTIELPHPDTNPLSPTLAVILGDLPLIQADITIVTNKDDPLVVDLDTTGIKVEDRNLMAEENCTLVIASDVLFHSELLQTAFNVLAEGAFILARENPNQKCMGNRYFRFETVFEKTLENEKFVLLRKEATVDGPAVIHVSAENYEWLPQLKAVTGKSSKQRILLVSQGEPLSGILGLVNCICKEPGGESLRCVFILDTSAPAFDLDLPLYRQQLNKDLVMNVYNNGQWGSYRHLPLDSCDAIPVLHAYLNVTTRGDLSSLKWIEGKLHPDRMSSQQKEKLIHVYYAALNFRDVMTATGKLAVEAACNSRLQQDCLQGLEYAGCDVKGRRVMGMGLYGYMATMVMPNEELTWNVPKHWTLEEAATVPVVYGTVYFALVINGRMKKGDSVLIHAGSGGVGQAAINVCLHAGCTVYTTVGTEEKRVFIKKQFPQLKDCNIGNSRDTSFEQMIMLETNGKGVDLILNSLSEEKLLASVHCLAIGGRFLEIGKFDISNNKPLGMDMFLKGTSFHGIMLDALFAGSSDDKKMIHDIIEEGIKSGAVQPLVRTVFAAEEAEQAFRYLAAGKHIGKVLLQIRQEEDRKLPAPSPLLITACPRYHCNPACTYIITGGLGGFGLELADWLVLRGAQMLVLTSRHGLRTGYQSARVRTWREYGVRVVISVADITTRTGVASLLSDANKLGPVDAIFNLAVVLKDALLQNQSEADFATSAGPKAQAALYLDEMSRQMCPQLRHFVMFSSVSCGRGNAGQTNYGMSNSIMERICEARVREGFPGLAVQWGAVGDVGLVADMQEDNIEIVIGGTLQQKISSCLEVLNGFMKQSYPVVASMVVAEKCRGATGSDNIVDIVSYILGIRDLKTVSLHSTLAELGMDSMMAVEVKQSLERELELLLTPQEVRNLTFARLTELSATKDAPKVIPEEQPTAMPLEGLRLILQTVGNEETAAQPVLHLPSAVGSGKNLENVAKPGPVLFMIPGVEGMGSILEPLARNLKYQTLCLQLGYSKQGETVQDMAQSLLMHIRTRLAPGNAFNLLGYSFGGILALELAHMLEADGLEGNIYLLDSSPDFAQNAIEHSLGHNEDQFEIRVICSIFTLVTPHGATSAAVSQLVAELTPLKSWNERLEHFIRMLPSTSHSMRHLKAVSTSAYTRLKAISSYKWGHKNSIKSHITLLRPDAMVLKTQEDYGLSQYCDKEVEVHIVTGNHVTMLDSKECASIINQHAADNEDAVLTNNIMSEGNREMHQK